MKKLIDDVLEGIYEEVILSLEFNEMCKEYGEKNKSFVDAAEKANKTFVKSVLEESVKKSLENDNILFATENEHEKRGFFIGFKIGMQLREECLSL